MHGLEAGATPSRTEGLSSAPRSIRYLPGSFIMGLILLIVVLVLIFGGGGGYYAHSRYGGAGLGGVLSLVLVILLILWLFGGIGSFR